MYSVKSYDRNGLFKVVRSNRPLPDTMTAHRLDLTSEHKHYDFKLSQSLSRSRSMIRDLVLSNDWDYFVTFTMSAKLVRNRYDFSSCLDEVRPWLHQMHRDNSRFRYVLVPELHKDGAIHFHGVVSGITVDHLPPEAKSPRKLGYEYHWPLWAQRFGYNTVSPILNPIGVGFYVSKYVTKDLVKTVVGLGQHTYFRSRGLRGAVSVGYSYRSFSDYFDRFLSSKYQYCSVGYFKSEYEVVCALLEDLSMYRDYYLYDDASADVVGLCGGLSEDVDFVVGLDQLALQGVFAVPVECYDT